MNIDGASSWITFATSTQIPFLVADPGSGAAIPVTKSATINLTIAGAETNTLAIPTFVGQELIINVDTRSAGSRVITSSQSINVAGNTIMTFDAVRDIIALVAVTIGGVNRWAVAYNANVALS